MKCLPRSANGIKLKLGNLEKICLEKVQPWSKMKPLKENPGNLMGMWAKSGHKALLVLVIEVGCALLVKIQMTTSSLRVRPRRRRRKFHILLSRGSSWSPTRISWHSRTCWKRKFYLRTPWSPLPPLWSPLPPPLTSLLPPLPWSPLPHPLTSPPLFWSRQIQKSQPKMLFRTL